MTSTRPLRHNRDFTLLWCGQAVSQLGTSTAQIAYPLLVLAMTHSPALMGLVGFAVGLPQIILGVPAGVIVDRVDRRRLMLVCDAVRAAGAASIAVAWFAAQLSFVQLLAVALVEGTMTVLAEPAEVGALRQIVTTDQLPEAIARNEARTYGAHIAGPPLGGILFGLGRALPFVFDTASYLASFVTLTLTRTPFQSDRTAFRRRLRTELIEGARFIWHQPFIRAWLTLAGAGNFVSNALTLIIIVLARQQGASPSLTGFTLAFAGIGGLLGALVAPTLVRKLSLTTATVVYTATYTTLIPLLAILPPLALGPVFGVMLFGAPTLNAIASAYEIALIPDHILGRVEAAASVITTGTGAISRLTAGLLLSTIGGTPTLLAYTTLSVATTAYALLNPNTRRPPVVAPAATARVGGVGAGE